MSKKLIIIGASGFGREVAWLVERINTVKNEWEIVGFIDDNPEIKNKQINGYKVLGCLEDLKNYSDCYFACAIGASKTREVVVNKLLSINPKVKFATLVDPSVVRSSLISIGEGSIICASNILTVNITIGQHVIINLDCTVGHDAILEDFVTVYPSVNISGNTKFAKCVELGTGTQVIQGKTVGEYTIIGAGAVVVKDLPARCTAVGLPAKPIKFEE